MKVTKKNVIFFSLLLVILMTVVLFSCQEKKSKDHGEDDVVINDCTVTFDYNYKNSPENIKVRVPMGRTISLNNVPAIKRDRESYERFEYEHIGWFYENGEKYNNMQDIINKDVVLHAKWQIKKMYMGYYPKTKVDKSEIADIVFIKENFNSKNLIGDNGIDKYLKTPDDEYFKFELVSWTYMRGNDIIDGKRIGYFIADEVLDGSKFAEKGLLVNVGAEKGIYERSAIREYLNKTLFDRMFSNEEMNQIVKIAIKNNNEAVEYHKELKTNDTIERIFLPSEKELSPEYLKCLVTDFAKKKIDRNEIYYPYWLRSPELTGLDLLDNVTKIKVRRNDGQSRVSMFYSTHGIRPIVVSYMD